MEIVWEARLDNKYDIRVVRTAPYHGRISVSDDGTELASQDVTLAYNAQFGADIDDISDWQDWAEKVVDGQKAE